MYLFLNNYFFNFEKLSSKLDLSIKRKQLLLLNEDSQENVILCLVVEFYLHGVYSVLLLWFWWDCVILHEFGTEGIKIEI